MVAPVRNSLGNQATVIPSEEILIGEALQFNDAGIFTELSMRKVDEVGHRIDGIALYNAAAQVPLSVQFGPGMVPVRIGAVAVRRGDELIANANGSFAPFPGVVGRKPTGLVALADAKANALGSAMFLGSGHGFGLENIAYIEAGGAFAIGRALTWTTGANSIGRMHYPPAATNSPDGISLAAAGAAGDIVPVQFPCGFAVIHANTAIGHGVSGKLTGLAGSFVAAANADSAGTIYSVVPVETIAADSLGLAMFYGPGRQKA